MKTVALILTIVASLAILWPQELAASPHSVLSGSGLTRQLARALHDEDVRFRAEAVWQDLSPTSLRLPAGAFSPAAVNPGSDGIDDNTAANSSPLRVNHSAAYDGLGRLTGYYQAATWQPAAPSDAVQFLYLGSVVQTTDMALNMQQDGNAYTQSQDGQTTIDCTAAAGTSCDVTSETLASGNVGLYANLSSNNCLAEIVGESTPATFAAQQSQITTTLANIIAAATTAVQAACPTAAAALTPMVSGWNLISQPLADGPQSLAAVLAALNDPAALGAGGAAATATYAHGKFSVYVPGYAADLALLASQGVFTLSKRAGSWLAGGAPYTAAQSTQLGSGWNLVAAPYPMDGLDTGAIDSELSPTCGLREIATFSGGSYTTYIPGVSASFHVPSTSAMWIECTSAYAWVPNSPQATVYEAESSFNSLAAGASPVACLPCSGSWRVGFIGNNSGTLQFNEVYAAAGGPHTVTLFYTNGDATRTASMSVNGGPAVTISFPSTGGWESVSTVATVVNLAPGYNSLMFSNSTAPGPDFDKLTVG